MKALIFSHGKLFACTWVITGLVEELIKPPENIKKL
jgi:hypothetical protein